MLRCDSNLLSFYFHVPKFWCYLKNNITICRHVSTLWTCSSNNRQWKKKMMKPNVKRCIEEYSYRCATFGCLRTLRDKMCIGGDLKLVWERTSYMYLSSERTLCEWKLTFPTTLLLVSLHKLMHFHKWTSTIKVAKNS